MISTEILVFVPPVANFQLRWLKDRQAAARTAALAIAATPGGVMPDDLVLQIFRGIDAEAIAIRTSHTRRLFATIHHLPAITRNVDVREGSVVRAVIESFETLLFDNSELIRVVGPAPMGDGFIEGIIETRHQRKAM